MSQLRISVADDEPDMREYYQRMLTHLGHHVVSCSANGRELVEECLRQLPDLVITDIKMPELDGLRAAEVVGQQYAVPVILVSAHYSPEIVERAKSASVQAFLTKPIKLADLAPKIDLARRRFERSRHLRLEEIEMRHARQNHRDNSEQRRQSDSLE